MQCKINGLDFLIVSTLSCPFPFVRSSPSPSPFSSSFNLPLTSPFSSSPSGIIPSELWVRSGISRSPISPSADTEMLEALCALELSEAVWVIKGEVWVVRG